MFLRSARGDTGTLQLSCVNFFSVLCTWCRVSFKRECYRGTVNTLRTKFSHWKWREPCISTFKRTQQNISQRWSYVRLYGPLHVYHLPGPTFQISFPRFSTRLETCGGFIKGILRGVRCTKSLRVLFLHRRPPSWTTLVLYTRAVFIFNEPAIGVAWSTPQTKSSSINLIKPRKLALTGRNTLFVL